MCIIIGKVIVLVVLRIEIFGMVERKYKCKIEEIIFFK